ncbi:magnesium transporter [Bacteroidota bacterium]
MSQDQELKQRRDIVQLLEENKMEELTVLIETMSSKEIVHLMGHLKWDDQVQLITKLAPENAADVIEELPDNQAVNIIEDLSEKDAAAILDQLDSNEQTDIIKELEDDDAYAILENMDPNEAAHVRKLRVYDDDTAGGLMRMEYFAFKEFETVDEITNQLRTHSDVYSDYPLKYIFVISAAGKLKGVLQMQDLLLADANTTLSKIIIENVRSFDHHATLEELINFFHENNWYGVPVVDENKILIGVVLRRDILEAETKKLTQEHLETQGIVGGEELRTMPVFLRARRRISWLSVNILLNIIAASVIAYYQDVLSAVIALAVFLPIISDMSGCSGNQAVAVSMRELSLGVVKPKEVLRVWFQEIQVGLINGIVLGILIGAAAWFWKGNIYLGMVVGGALTINTLVAVSLGGTIPLILKSLKIDPALASGPILTTVTDMFGFFLALTFAAAAMNHLGGI